MTSTPNEPAVPTRWEAQWSADPAGWQGYADRFERFYTEGADMDGEARFVDMMVPRRSRLLDAGCGTGRVAAALVDRGHDAVGVDKDAGLVAIAVGRYPGVRYVVGDLAQPLAPVVAPDASGQAPLFDAIVCAGNVMVFAAPGSGGQIASELDAVLQPGGRAVFGFATDREYTVADLDADAAQAGWTLEHRFATWHLDPYSDESDWAVSVFRKPGHP